MTTPAHQRARAVAEKWYDKCDEGAITNGQYDELINAIAAALDAEIEACAKVADEVVGDADDITDAPTRLAARAIAAAIRQRKGVR